MVYTPARTARARRAHLPEVVLRVTRQDVVLGDTDIEPVLLGLKIGLKTVLRVALEVGDVKPVPW